MYRENRQSGRILLKRRDDETEYLAEHFDTEYWKRQTGSSVLSSKRGDSVKFSFDGREVILRRYYRGGLVQKLITDQYLWLGRSRSRPHQEWIILDKAREAGLPVPEPVAACVLRSGVWYRGAIIMTFLGDTEILADRLGRTRLNEEAWYQLGLLIREMHGAGIRHADLNASNILIDSKDRFSLVDFDKARMMPELGDWQWRPLFRLQRSLDKFNRDLGLHYRDEDWQTLMDGYQS